jgi:hypothetical protein
MRWLAMMGSHHVDLMRRGETLETDWRCMAGCVLSSRLGQTGDGWSAFLSGIYPFFPVAGLGPVVDSAAVDLVAPPASSLMSHTAHDL